MAATARGRAVLISACPMETVHEAEEFEIDMTELLGPPAKDSVSHVVLNPLLTIC